MGKRKRVPVIVEEGDENEECEVDVRNTSSSSTLQGPMYTIMSNVQLGETLHKKYIKELRHLYEQMDHDAFMFTFIKLLKTPMEADEGNEYALTTLNFCAKFISSYDNEDTHPLVSDIFKWLLSTISNNSHIRFRLCQFVNLILNALGPEAALDDRICDCILEYMLERLRDTSPNVRFQAIFAMQRLQMPDNPDDPVLRAYQYHLCSDPSAKVRQAVITCMGRNFNTIPYILDRLWDIDEKVRRHTYVHMSSYPVRSYKVSQRLTLLEQGLNDRSEGVRKVVASIMLTQWLESYQKNFIALISALKLDANESEIERFRKITKQMLIEIFKKQSKDDLLNCLSLIEEGEFHRCIPHENLTIENAFYWECLTQYFSSIEADELDFIVPELSVMCNYVQRYCEDYGSTTDKFEQLEFMFKLLSLMEILYSYDLSDEIGRNNLKQFLSYLLKNYTVDQRIIQVIVKCAENLIEDLNQRLQFFVDIIRDNCDLNPKSNDLITTCNLEQLLANCPQDLHLKISSLKVKFMDLEEQEMNLLKEKNYVRAQEVTEAKNATREEFNTLVEKYSNQNGKTSNVNKPVRNETDLKCLQLTYYMIVSEKVKSLNAVACQLYHDFICRHLASNQIIIRDWALKCGTAYSMLYEALAKDVFKELYSQFFKNHNIRLWETSISCIFELLDRYGVETFMEEDANKTKKSSAAGRQLYNTMEFLEDEDERNNSLTGQGVGIVYMMSHFLDTCDDICIIRSIIIGFCRLILRGHITSSDIIEKLLLRYFNPATEPEISQVLGVFLENMIEQRDYGLLQISLLPTVATVMGAPYDSPLNEIKPETITRFVIDFTRQDPNKGTDNLHNKIAFSFLQEMLNNISNKELCKLLAKELLTLEVNLGLCEDLKDQMKEMADKLIKIEFDPRTIKNIINFKDLMDGKFNPPVAIQRPRDNEESENEEEEDEDDLNTLNENNDGGTTAVNNREDNNVRAMESMRNLEENLMHDLLEDSRRITLNNNKSIRNIERTPKMPAAGAAGASTMYGERNSLVHNSLRKSLNASLNQTPNRQQTNKRILMNTSVVLSPAKKTRSKNKQQQLEVKEIEKENSDKDSSKDSVKDSEDLKKNPKKTSNRNVKDLVDEAGPKTPSRRLRNVATPKGKTQKYMSTRNRKRKSLSPSEKSKPNSNDLETSSGNDEENMKDKNSPKENLPENVENSKQSPENEPEMVSKNGPRNVSKKGAKRDAQKPTETEPESEQETEMETERELEHEPANDPQSGAEVTAQKEGENALEKGAEITSPKRAEINPKNGPENAPENSSKKVPGNDSEMESSPKLNVENSAEIVAENNSKVDIENAPENTDENASDSDNDLEIRSINEPDEDSDHDLVTELEILNDLHPEQVQEVSSTEDKAKEQQEKPEENMDSFEEKFDPKKNPLKNTRQTRRNVGKSLTPKQIISLLSSSDEESLDDSNEIIPATQTPSKDLSKLISNNNNNEGKANTSEILSTTNEEENANSTSRVRKSFVRLNRLRNLTRKQNKTNSSPAGNKSSHNSLKEKEIETILDKESDKEKEKENSIQASATTSTSASRSRRLISTRLQASNQAATTTTENSTKTPTRRRMPSRKVLENESNSTKSFTSTPILGKNNPKINFLHDQTEQQVEELNNSDVIPASPQANTDSIYANSTRLRRVLLANSTAKVTRSSRRRQQAETSASAPTLTVTSTSSNSTSSLQDKPTTTNDDGTPIRNGRKRALRISPKARPTIPINPKTTTGAASTTSNDDDGSELPIISPMRKQSRLSEEANKTKTNNNNNSGGRATKTTTNNELGSPSSLKENENTTNHNTRRAAANSSKTLNNSSSEKSPIATKTPGASRKRSNPGSQQTTPSTPAALLPRNKVVTRNSARKAQMNQVIMTRKRLSLELNSSVTEKSIRSPEQLQPQRKRMKISKIPVMSKKLTTTTATTTITTRGTAATTTKATLNKSSSTSALKTPTTTAGAMSTLNSSTRSLNGENNTNNNNSNSSSNHMISSPSRVTTSIIQASTSNNRQASSYTYSSSSSTTITTTSPRAFSIHHQQSQQQQSPSSLATTTTTIEQQKSKIVIIASIDSSKRNPPSRLPQPTYRRSKERN